MVLGDVDTGKTTFSQYLTYRLLQDNKKVYFIDSDIGQSTISPPSTIGIKKFSSMPENIGKFHYDIMYFVGDITPAGNLLQLITGLKLVFEKVQEVYGSSYMVMDTTGLVKGSIGNELKIQKIRLIQPDIIVAIQKNQELDPILRNFYSNEEIKIIKMSPANVKKRNRKEKNYIDNVYLVLILKIVNLQS